MKTVPSTLASDDLTNADKKQILRDFDEWSGGFEPDEVSPKKLKSYIDTGIGSEFTAKKDAVQKWLMNWDGDDGSELDIARLDHIVQTLTKELQPGGGRTHWGGDLSTYVDERMGDLDWQGGDGGDLDEAKKYIMDRLPKDAK